MQLKCSFLSLLLCSIAFISTAQAQIADLILQNGRILDGTGNSWYKSNIAITNGKILAIGKLNGWTATRVIDVQNQIIAPGFIDVHTHIEGEEKKNPLAENFILDGVTTVVTGNCGLGQTNISRLKPTSTVVDEIADAFLLDAVITVVDARHGSQQLDEHKEAVEQVGFADRILMSKVDITPEADREKLRQRLVRINPRAPIRPVNFGDADIADILDIRGFNLNAILEIDPQFLTSDEHEHDEAVQSFVYRSNRAFDPVKLEDFLGGIIQVYGQDMLRYKGVLFMKGSDRQTVFQGVHQMMGADMGRKWQPGEKRSSKMVFIGRNLPKDMFIKGLEQCLA